MSGYIEPCVTEIRDDGEELIYDQRDRDRSDRKYGNASTTAADTSQSQSAGLGDVSPEVIARLKEELKEEIKSESKSGTCYFLLGFEQVIFVFAFAGWSC